MRPGRSLLLCAAALAGAGGHSRRHQYLQAVEFPYYLYRARYGSVSWCG